MRCTGRVSQERSEVKKGTFLCADAFGSAIEAEDQAERHRKAGRSSRIYQRSVKADNRELWLWVVITRERKARGREVSRG